MNTLLIPLAGERETAYCATCGRDHHDGIVCRCCQDFYCASCLAQHPMGDALVAMERCPEHLPGAVVDLVEAVDDLARFERHMADRIAAELLKGRAA